MKDKAANESNLKIVTPKNNQIKPLRNGIYYQDLVSLWLLLDHYKREQQFVFEAEHAKRGIFDDVNIHVGGTLQIYQIKNTEDKENKKKKELTIADFVNNTDKKLIQIHRLFNSWLKTKREKRDTKIKCILFTHKGLNDKVAELTEEILPEDKLGKCCKFKNDEEIGGIRSLKEAIRGKSEYKNYYSKQEFENLIDEFLASFYVHYNKPDIGQYEELILSMLEELELSGKPMFDALQAFIRRYIVNGKFALKPIDLKNLLKELEVYCKSLEHLKGESQAFFKRQVKEKIVRGKSIIEINRSALISKIEQTISRSHCLIVGEHGIGKSVLIKKIFAEKDNYMLLDVNNIKNIAFISNLSRDKIYYKTLDYLLKQIKFIIIENSENLQDKDIDMLLFFAKKCVEKSKDIKFIFVSVNKQIKKKLEKQDFTGIEEIRIDLLEDEQVKEYFPELKTLIENNIAGNIIRIPFFLNIIVDHYTSKALKQREELESLTFYKPEENFELHFAIINLQLGKGRDANLYKEKKNILCKLLLKKPINKDSDSYKELLANNIIYILNDQGQPEFRHSLYRFWSLNILIKTYLDAHVFRALDSNMNIFLESIASIDYKKLEMVLLFLKKSMVFYEYSSNINYKTLSDKAKEILLEYIEQDESFVYQILKNKFYNLLNAYLDCPNIIPCQVPFLHAAITLDDIEAAEMIINKAPFDLYNYAADYDSGYDSIDCLPINHAIADKRNKIVELILKLEPEYNKPPYSFNLYCELGYPLIVACKNSNIEALKMLLETPSIEPAKQIEEEYSWNTLHWCVFSGKIGMVILLLKDRKIDINSAVKRLSPLHIGKNDESLYLFLADQTAVHLAIQRDEPKILELLIQHGGNPNAQAEYGVTPLHLAVITKKLACIEILLKYLEPASIREPLSASIDEAKYSDDIDISIEKNDTPLIIAEKLKDKDIITSLRKMLPPAQSLNLKKDDKKIVHDIKKRNSSEGDYRGQFFKKPNTNSLNKPALNISIANYSIKNVAEPKKLQQ